MAALSKVEIQEKLKKMDGWSHAGKAIHKKYSLKTFPGAIALVNKIAEAAEKASHHPDITINYNLLSVSISTHSEGGVTEKDFALAQEIDRLAASQS